MVFIRDSESWRKTQRFTDTIKLGTEDKLLCRIIDPLYLPAFYLPRTLEYLVRRNEFIELWDCIKQFSDECEYPIYMGYSHKECSPGLYPSTQRCKDKTLLNIITTFGQYCSEMSGLLFDAFTGDTKQVWPENSIYERVSIMLYGTGSRSYRRRPCSGFVSAVVSIAPDGGYDMIFSPKDSSPFRLKLKGMQIFFADFHKLRYGVLRKKHDKKCIQLMFTRNEIISKNILSGLLSLHE